MVPGTQIGRKETEDVLGGVPAEAAAWAGGKAAAVESGEEPEAGAGTATEAARRGEGGIWRWPGAGSAGCVTRRGAAGNRGSGTVYGGNPGRDRGDVTRQAGAESAQPERGEREKGETRWDKKGGLSRAGLKNASRIWSGFGGGNLGQRVTRTAGFEEGRSPSFTVDDERYGNGNRAVGSAVRGAVCAAEAAGSGRADGDERRGPAEPGGCRCRSWAVGGDRRVQGGQSGPAARAGHGGRNGVGTVRGRGPDATGCTSAAGANERFGRSVADRGPGRRDRRNPGRDSAATVA